MTTPRRFIFNFFHSTTVMFDFTGPEMIPTGILRDLTAEILACATQMWFGSDKEYLGDCIDMSSLRDSLQQDGKVELLQWLQPYSILSLRNGDIANICIELN